MELRQKSALVVIEIFLGAHVEYDEENDVKAVENNKDPEQPPGGRVWK